MMELDPTTFFHLQRPYKYGGNPYLTKLNRRMEMGNSLTKLPLTSPWEQWDKEEKQSNEDIYSHIWIGFMS